MKGGGKKILVSFAGITEYIETIDLLFRGLEPYGFSRTRGVVDVRVYYVIILTSKGFAPSPHPPHPNPTPHTPLQPVRRRFLCVDTCMRFVDESTP